MKCVIVNICRTTACFLLLFLCGCNRQNVTKSNSNANAGIKWTDYDDEYIIPDLSKWGQIEVGMSEEELTQLLGTPINKIGPSGDYEPGIHYPLYYGYVSKESEVFPQDLYFIVYLEQGKVVSVRDWFGGVALSKDGSPTIPKLLTPADNTKFNHFPRIVDFRWYASSGNYPMRYEIDADTLVGEDSWIDDGDPIDVEKPYCSYIHSGANKGRWRVRAVNEKGTSEWSEFQYFTFTQ